MISLVVAACHDSESAVWQPASVAAWTIRTSYRSLSIGMSSLVLLPCTILYSTKSTIAPLRNLPNSASLWL